MTSDLLLAIGGALALPLLVIMAFGLAGHPAQTGLTASGEKLKPSLERIDPMKGFGRIFGRDGLVAFAKSLFKILCVGVAGTIVLWGALGPITQTAASDPAGLIGAAMDLAWQMLMAMLAVLAVFAVLDYGYQRWSWYERQRMSRQELRDEFKQTEGDPHVKARLKQIRAQKSRQRML